jgi:hypothetical protein
MTPVEKIRDALKWRSPLANKPMAHVVLEREDAEVVLARIDALEETVRRIAAILKGEQP